MPKSSKIFLIATLTSSIIFASDIEKYPNFVVNSIVRVPDNFEKLKEIEEYRIQVGKLPYYIQNNSNSNNPKRGKICSHSFILNKNEEPYKFSIILEPFIRKIMEESFAKTREESTLISSKRVAVAMLLDRMKSMDDHSNNNFF